MTDHQKDLQDIDAIVALDIQREEERAPLQGIDAIAVRAIIGLSRAGTELMTEAAHAHAHDVDRISKRAREQLDLARTLMSDFTVTREVDQ